MRGIFGLVLLVGLGLAGFAVYTVQGYFEQQEARISQTTPTVTVLAIKETVEFGEPILPSNLHYIEYAEQHLPEGIFLLSSETTDSGGPIIQTSAGLDFVPEGSTGPRYALRQIEANEPLIDVKLSEPGQETTVVNSLTPGMRAFDIQVNLSTGSSGFLRPGDRVDVFWTGSVENGLSRQEMTRGILSGLRIVAVDQSTDRARVATTPPRSVTVEVSPQQVGNLAQARRTGDLSLALVGSRGDDVEIVQVEVDQDSLLGIERAEVVAPEPEQAEVERCFVMVGIGQNRTASDTEIPCAD